MLSLSLSYGITVKFYTRRIPCIFIICFVRRVFDLLNIVVFNRISVREKHRVQTIKHCVLYALNPAKMSAECTIYIYSVFYCGFSVPLSNKMWKSVNHGETFWLRVFYERKKFWRNRNFLTQISRTNKNVDNILYECDTSTVRSGRAKKTGRTKWSANKT